MQFKLIEKDSEKCDIFEKIPLLNDLFTCIIKYLLSLTYIYYYNIITYLLSITYICLSGNYFLSLSLSFSLSLSLYIYIYIYIYIVVWYSTKIIKSWYILFRRKFNFYDKYVAFTNILGKLYLYF